MSGTELMQTAYVSGQNEHYKAESLRIWFFPKYLRYPQLPTGCLHCHPHNFKNSKSSRKCRKKRNFSVRNSFRKLLPLNYFISFYLVPKWGLYSVKNDEKCWDLLAAATVRVKSKIGFSLTTMTVIWKVKLRHRFLDSAGKVAPRTQFQHFWWKQKCWPICYSFLDSNRNKKQ